MKQLTDRELEKAAILKVARAAIRVKHAVRADAEINARLPKLSIQIEAAMLRGAPLTVGYARAWGGGENECS